MGWKEFFKQLLIVFVVLLPNIGGIIGAITTRSSIKEWYETLILPPFRPPNWVSRNLVLIFAFNVHY